MLIAFKGEYLKSALFVHYKAFPLFHLPSSLAKFNSLLPFLPFFYFFSFSSFSFLLSFLLHVSMNSKLYLSNEFEINEIWCPEGMNRIGETKQKVTVLFQVQIQIIILIEILSVIFAHTENHLAREIKKLTCI